MVAAGNYKLFIQLVLTLIFNLFHWIQTIIAWDYLLAVCGTSIVEVNRLAS